MSNDFSIPQPLQQMDASARDLMDCGRNADALAVLDAIIAAYADTPNAMQDNGKPTCDW